MKRFNPTTVLLLLCIAFAAFFAVPAAAQSRFDLPLACANDVDLNTDETDKTITIPNGSTYYVITRMIVYNASVTLAGSAAEIGLFTGATGTGTTIITPTTMTGLTATTKFKADWTIANTTDLLTANTLYIHTDDAHGSAATVDVCVYGYLTNDNQTIGL